MLIYNYHPETGEYAGSVEAELSPFDDGEYLIPAHATTTAPPETVSGGYALIFDGAAWAEIEDHRGETWWTAEGAAMNVLKLGNPVDHGLGQEPPPEPKVGRICFAMIDDAGNVVQVLESDNPMQWRLAPGFRMVVDGEAEARPGYIYDEESRTFEPPPETELEPEPIE